MVIFLMILAVRFESLFKVKGGVDYMYYFIDISVGNPG